MVVREAMAHGRAVVATAVGGIADAVVDGESGLLVEAGDEVGLRAAVVRLLEDPALRGRLGAAARERVRRESEPAIAALAAAYKQASGLVPTARVDDLHVREGRQERA